MTQLYNIKHLGEIAKDKRKRLGLTQEQLSGIAGVGVRFVSDFERGKVTVEIGKAFQLLQRLGLDLWVENRGESPLSHTGAKK